ncbi:hypothetical protein [Prauserella cavernicola]|nr:hypothetical protein [Prauserella cavernicola]
MGWQQGAHVPVPAAVLRPGRNTLTLGKTAGSWHAYDALGVFEPA